MAYKRPGVYVEEISTLPPSVAPVATAVPAFIGYTKKAVDEEGKPLKGIIYGEEAQEVVVKRITNMLEYEHFFGLAETASFMLASDETTNNPNDYIIERLDQNGQPTNAPLHSHLLYYAVKMYFDNGGGPCYIVSVGRYTDAISPAHFEYGLNSLEKEDEPTLIVIVDGILLGPEYYKFCEKVLAHCKKLKDRFGIFDILDEDKEGNDFRQAIGMKYLSYGAGYVPYLLSSLQYQFKENQVNLGPFFWRTSFEDGSGNGLGVSFAGFASRPTIEIPSVDVDQGLLSLGFQINGSTLIIAGVPETGENPNNILNEWNSVPDKGRFTIAESGNTTILPGQSYELSENYWGVKLPAGEADPGIAVLYPLESIADPVPNVEVTPISLSVDESVPDSPSLTINGVSDQGKSPDEILRAWGLTTNKGAFQLYKIGDATIKPVLDQQDPIQPSTINLTNFPGLLVKEQEINEYAILYYGEVSGEPVVKVEQTGDVFDFITNGNQLTINIPKRNPGEDPVKAKDIFEAWLKLDLSERGEFIIDLLGSGENEISAQDYPLDQNIPGVILPENHDTEVKGLFAAYLLPDASNVSLQIDPSAPLSITFGRSGEKLGIMGVDEVAGISPTDLETEWQSFTNKGEFEFIKFSDTYIKVTPDRIDLTGKYQAAKIPDDTNPGIIILYELSNQSIPRVEILSNQPDEITFDISTANELTISGVGSSGKKASKIAEAWTEWEGNKGSFNIYQIGTGDFLITATSAPKEMGDEAVLSSLEFTHTQLYNKYKAEVAKQRVVLPPSSAIAGIYASVDRDRGVWKAPANVSVSSMLKPVQKITNEQQERLNIDPTSGKSINAIRSFAGKGTLVWGSRTLAGNDNEWRYIPVRRLFIFIEESLKKATEFAVFEPNTTTTWLKVKAMAESFLFNLWQRGALAGPTPDAAYYVNIGLGKTMTTQDILEGRLFVEIGLAAVRPAEFIILRFMHKLQEA